MCSAWTLSPSDDNTSAGYFRDSIFHEFPLISNVKEVIFTDVLLWTLILSV